MKLKRYPGKKPSTYRYVLRELSCARCNNGFQTYGRNVKYCPLCRDEIDGAKESLGYKANITHTRNRRLRWFKKYPEDFNKQRKAALEKIVKKKVVRPYPMFYYYDITNGEYLTTRNFPKELIRLKEKPSQKMNRLLRS